MYAKHNWFNDFDFYIQPKFILYTTIYIVQHLFLHCNLFYNKVKLISFIDSLVGKNAPDILNTILSIKIMKQLVLLCKKQFYFIKNI